MARPGPRVTSGNTTFQLRLKIALVFDAVFLRFWLHLGSQDGLENRPESFKNRLRKCTPISNRFRSNFHSFCYFSTPVFYNCPIFLLSFLLGSILEYLGLHFGLVSGSFFLFFSLPKTIEKSMFFCIVCEFGSILAPNGAPTLTPEPENHDSHFSCFGLVLGPF